MRLGDTILTATQNLGRRKVRTVLTSIGVFVGILTIVTMVSLGIGIQQQVTDTIKQFGLDTVYASPRLSGQAATANTPLTQSSIVTPITPEALSRIMQISGVKSVEVAVSLPTAPEMRLSVGNSSFSIATGDIQLEDRVFSTQQVFLAGRGLPYTPDASGIVLGQRLLKSAGFTPSQYASLVGKPATITVLAPRGDTATFQTTIVGVSNVILGTGDNTNVEMGNADKLAIKKWWYNNPNILETQGYSSIVVHANTINDATRVSTQIQAMGFRTTTLQILLDQVNRIFAILQTMLSSVGLLALLVASIGIINTMVMAIYERTREIGVLKALGSSNGDVLRMFMVEAGLIGLLGGITGVLGGWGLGLLLNVVIRSYFQGQQLPIDAPFFVVTWELVGGALVFATIIGILAGLYPAFRAARLDPLAALRHE